MGAPESNDSETMSHVSERNERRRLAAIPFVEEEQSTVMGKTILQQPTHVSIPLVSVMTTAIICAGCTLRRYLKKLKQVPRDSFGFISENLRTSLDAAELSV